MSDTHSDINTPGIVSPSTNAASPELQMVEQPGSVIEGQSALPVGPVEPGAQTSKQSRSPFQESLGRLRRDKRAMVSLSIILFLIVLALFGPLIYIHIGGPYQSISGKTIGPEVYHDFTHQETDRQSEGPSGQYWLGTDDIGRDQFARLMQGLRISIANAVFVEIINITLGIVIGVLAGFFGGWVDQLLARFADLMFAFPGLLFVILIAGILGPWADSALSQVPIIGANGNARLLLVSMALAFTAWPLMARYVRGQTLQLKEQQFIEAARTAGTNNAKIIMRHIVPNLFSIVVVASTLNISGTIVGEAGISFLGLGVRPPGSSLGLMIQSGSRYVTVAPWELLIPALALVLLVLSFSFLGDGLRDAFDPRSKD